MSDPLWPSGPKLPTSIPDSELKTAGPLSRLMRGLGLDDNLAPIAALKRIEEMPVQVSTPVSASTSADLICPTCKTFEIPPGLALCPRCNRIAENLARKSAERHRHADGIRRELLAARLDKIDPDWPNKFLSTDAAERFYRAELAAMEPKL